MEVRITGEPVFIGELTMATRATMAIATAAPRIGMMVPGMPMARAVALRVGTTGREAPRVGAGARRRGTTGPVILADIAAVRLPGAAVRAPSMAPTVGRAAGGDNRSDGRARRSRC